MINWVENGVAPDSLTSTTQVPKLCPFPKWAIYNGSGSTADANNYTCGGNLDANPVALCQMSHTKYKHEDTAALNASETSIPPGQCEKLEKKQK